MADRMTGNTLAETLRSQRAEGLSLRAIAADLNDRYGVDISHVTVGVWLETLTSDEAAA